MEKAYLKSDISSHASKKIYGIAGELVSVVSVRDHVVIVENTSGVRFPVVSDKLIPSNHSGNASPLRILK